jgi:hypothetical protein
MGSKTVDEQGNEVATTRAVTPVPADRAAVEQAARALLALIPDAPEDDGSAIMARLLGATDWEQFNEQAKLPNGKDMARRELVVRGMVKRPSELEAEPDGTGLRLDHYLVVDSVTLGGGEEVRWQTSAPALVVPLAKLWVWKKLPAVVRVDVAEKATRRGFRPLNLTVLSVNSA